MAGPEVKASWLPTVLEYKGISYILSSVWWWSIMVFDTHCLVLEYKGLGYIMYIVRNKGSWLNIVCCWKKGSCQHTVWCWMIGSWLRTVLTWSIGSCLLTDWCLSKRVFATYCLLLGYRVLGFLLCWCWSEGIFATYCLVLDDKGVFSIMYFAGI